MNKKYFAFVFFAAIGAIFSFTFAEGLYSAQKKYINEVFVESGATATGQAISWAWNNGYKKIYMIDSNPVLVEHAKYLFTTYFDMYPTWRPIAYSDWKPDLHFILGDSAQELINVIKDIDAPITFFLHNYRATPDETETTNNILMELAQIQQHPIKTHTIFIDNIDLAGTSLFGNVTLDEIMAQLLSINADYVFTYYYGGHLERRPKALLIASIRDR